MKKTLSILAALALAGVVALTGCGSSSDNSSSSSSSSGGIYGSEGSESSAKTTSSEAPGSGAAAVISTTAVPKLGTVLVDSKGFTVYNFHKDKQGGQSSCYGPCAKAWPPLLTEGKPEAGEGAMAAKLGTTERKDGTMQVTYAGWPLYGFVEDKKPGETNGNDVSAFGAQWYALLPSGREPSD